MNLKSLWNFFLLLLAFAAFHSIALGNEPDSNKDLVNRATYLLITVDTESLYRSNFDLPLQWDTRIGNLNCGIEEMIKIANIYNAKITFYFDVYESAIFGEEATKKIVQKIVEKGHDVQLHTHPEFLFDEKRLKMYEYSFKEQNEIIKTGIKLLTEWMGIPPVAHRAGIYSANNDTLSALIENDILVDSSYRYLYPECHLDDKSFNKNALTRKKTLLEIPVTVFYVKEYYGLAGYKFPAKKRLKKLDIDSCELNLLKSATNELIKANIRVVTLFMHSWSFVKNWSDNSQNRIGDDVDIAKFEEYLKWVEKNSNIKPVSTSKLAELWKKDGLAFEKNDFVPEFSIKVDSITYLRRLLGINRENILYWSLGLFSSIFFAAAVILLTTSFRRKKISEV
jgi:hypothetical protein